MSTKLTDKITTYLDKHSIPYILIEHSETHTSEESYQARAKRGFSNTTGAKALLMRVEQKYAISFNMFVLPSYLKCNSKILKEYFPNLKRLRFATQQELAALTDGLVPGAVPPFGQPIFPRVNALFIDSQLLACDPIAFNAASLRHSLILKCSDYVQVAQPNATFSFSEQQ